MVAPSVVGRDVAFDDLRFLPEQLREAIADVIGRDADRLVRACLVVEDAERGAFPFAGIEPVVALKSLGLPHNRYEFLSYKTINFSAVLLVEVIVANHGKHRAPPQMRTQIMSQPAARQRILWSSVPTNSSTPSHPAQSPPRRCGCRRSPPS